MLREVSPVIEKIHELEWPQQPSSPFSLLLAADPDSTAALALHRLACNCL